MAERAVFARPLRKRSTDAERKLWNHLRARQLAGAKFRRQVPIGDFIVDFASYDRRLVVELDGSQHAEPAHRARDAARDHWLRSQGFAVLRFWDTDVLQRPDAVLSAILDALDHPADR